MPVAIVDAEHCKSISIITHCMPHSIPSTHGGSVWLMPMHNMMNVFASLSSAPEPFPQKFKMSKNAFRSLLQ